MPAELITRFKDITSDGAILEVVIWKVPAPVPPTEHGYKYSAVYVVDGVRVVGFDDAGFASLVTPPLTTVRQPCQEIAISAFRAMLDRLVDPSFPPRSISLTPSLVVRESCGAYIKG